MKKTVIIILILLTSCTNSTYNDIVEEDFSLILKWNKSYEEDTISNAIIGLQWCLSYLGATLPITENGIKNQNPFIILKINKLGFNVDALEKLKRLNTVIKATEEYQITSAIDLGRYVSLLIGSSEHYYEITGVPFLLSDLSTLMNSRIWAVMLIILVFRMKIESLDFLNKMVLTSCFYAQKLVRSLKRF